LKVDASSTLPEHPGVAEDRQSTTISIQQWKDGKLYQPTDDMVAVEEPLEIRVRGQNVAITMRTPGHDAELAAGFLATEGLIKSKEDVTEIAYCKKGEAAQFENTLNIFLAPNVEVDMKSLTRHVFASSSCGICGKATIEAVQQDFPSLVSEVCVTPRVITQLPAKLREAQATFEQTGGLHAAAMFDTQGKLLILREDVGRHNAVDKVVGFGLLNDISYTKCVLMVSGRASFEIMQKALAAQVPIVAAVSAPSSLAVEFARESGQTLIGFLRGETMNIYTHADRIGS